MFTSRAEHRISLRHDSSDTRLFQRGYEVGLKSDEQYHEFLAKQQGIDEIKELLRSNRVSEGDATGKLQRHVGKSLYQALKDPEVALVDLVSGDPATGSKPVEWLRQVELDVKYEGYVARQERQIARFQKLEQQRIPDSFDYGAIPGLSSESRERLSEIRPLSLGQASRVPGVRNADIAVLMVALERSKRVGSRVSSS
jgi:tRNA uridine 5-carboxymethylaminomethyl modification enzyme